MNPFVLDHVYRCGASVPESIIGLDLPVETLAILQGLATENGVSLNELIIQVATEHAREVLGEHLV